MSLHRAAVLLIAGCLAAGLNLPAAAQATAGSQPFDGTWQTTLVCEDVHSDGHLVKGYTFEFEVQVKGGHLEGQYGQAGQNSSVHFEGQILPDGQALVRAKGFTGSPEYTPSRAQPGTRYAYALRGSFEGDHATLTRQHLRPCKASFTRRP